MLHKIKVPIPVSDGEPLEDFYPDLMRAMMLEFDAREEVASFNFQTTNADVQYPFMTIVGKSGAIYILEVD